MLLSFYESWSRYLGHFHPVVVHLPMGILVAALLLEWVARRRGQQAALHAAISIALLAGCLTAMLSCLLGWWLSAAGGYEETTLQLHQWMGIATALLAGCCWLLKQKASADRLYKYSLILLVIVLTITGHFGGNMTHGADYLSAGLPQPFAGWLGTTNANDSQYRRKPITDLPGAAVFQELVMPILSEKCFSCHSAKKIKGGLRLDTEALIFKGGKHGAVIKPGMADQSELIARLLLPESDDKRMPPKDQEPITAAETAVLTWWIEKGADTQKTVQELKADSLMLITLQEVAGSKAPSDTVHQLPRSAVYQQNIAAADPAIVQQLQQLGVLIAPLAQQSTLLQLSCINYPSFGDAQIALLEKIAPNIIWLRLDHTAISDAGLARLSALKNLVRLNVANTKITTAGLKALKTVTTLEYLNITNTACTDEALTFLSGMPQLKHIYCWQTKITADAAANFMKNNPQTKVNNGSPEK